MGQGRCGTGSTRATWGRSGGARLGLVGALLALGLLVGAPSTQAVTFTLDSDQCSGGCGTPLFGTVTLTQNGSTVDVTVHLNPGNAFVKTGAGDRQAFLFSVQGVALADITVDAHTPTLVAVQGSFGQGGVGDLDFGIGCPTCKNGGAGQFTNDIVFHVAHASLADFSANAKGIFFVADILGANGKTGLVAAQAPVTTPEPSAVLLLAIGLVGVAGSTWRLRKYRAL